MWLSKPCSLLAYREILASCQKIVCRALQSVLDGLDLDGAALVRSFVLGSSFIVFFILLCLISATY